MVEMNKVSNNFYTTNTLKAITILILITLSPLKKVEIQSQNVINKQIYKNAYIDADNNAHNLLVSYIDTDGNKSNVEKVMINVLNDNLDLYNKTPSGTIKSFTNFDIRIYGSDGKYFGNFTGSQIRLSDGHTIANERVVNDIERFIRLGLSNNAFTSREINSNIYPTPSQNGSSVLFKKTTNADSEWLNMARNSEEYNYGILLKAGTLKTYSLAFYSTDENYKTCDIIVARKDDGTKLLIKGITELHCHIIAEDGTDINEYLGLIEVSWPKSGKHYIFDNELYEALLELSNDPMFEKAVNVSKKEQFYRISDDGIFNAVPKSIFDIL